MSESRSFPLGVYMKPNGKLVLIEYSKEDELYFVFDGRVSNSPLAKLFFKKKDRPLAGWSCNVNRFGWGPTSYLHKCEYLGEL